MKHIHILPYILITLVVVGCSSAPQYRSPLPISKEATFIENIEGKEDRFLAWGIGENNAMAEEDALKAALYAVMCGGSVGNGTSLMTTKERMEHQEFIYDFFSYPEEWTKYVRSVNHGRIDADRRIRVNDGNIKLGVDVVVSRKMLREYLEYKNIIGGMRIGE